MGLPTTHYPGDTMADDKNNEQTNPDADGSLDFSLDQSLVLKTGDEKGSGNEKGSVHETYASDEFVDDGTSMDLDAGLAAAFGGGDDADDGLSDDGDDNARQDDTERDSLTVSSVGSPSGGSVRSGQQDETRETAIRVREGSSIFADKYELIRHGTPGAGHDGSSQHRSSVGCWRIRVAAVLCDGTGGRHTHHQVLRRAPVDDFRTFEVVCSSLSCDSTCTPKRRDPPRHQTFQCTRCSLRRSTSSQSD